ncbi:MAG TPA: nucleotidyltransferase family protein, partial [Thermoanaerobaculia bacterium]
MSDPLLLPQRLWPLFLRLVFGSESPPLDSAAARDRLIKVATDEGLLPLLLADPHVPPGIAALRPTMRALGALMSARYTLQLDAAKQLAALVGESMFIKGFDYRHRLYPSPSLRPSTDLDAFIPRASIPAATQALHAAGHAQVESKLGRAAIEYYELAYDIGQVRVELHRSIGHRVRASVDYDELWSRRESFEAGGATFFRPSAVDAIVIHAITLA